MIGIIINVNTVMKDFFLDYCDAYVYKVFSSTAGTFPLFWSRFLKDVIFLAILVISSLCPFCLVLQAIAVFLVGYFFGVEAVILFNVYGFVGFWVFLLLVLPQFLILEGILVLASPVTFGCAVQNFSSFSPYFLRDELRWLLIFGAIFLLSAVLESLTVLLFFRPFGWIL